MSSLRVCPYPAPEGQGLAKRDAFWLLNFLTVKLSQASSCPKHFEQQDFKLVGNNEGIALEALLTGSYNWGCEPSIVMWMENSVGAVYGCQSP